MDKRIMFDFMHKLFINSYSGKNVSVHLNSKDNVLSTDMSFEFKDFQISDDKQKITLFGEEDLQVTFNPQNIVKIEKENDTFLFDTDNVEMAVDFI